MRSNTAEAKNPISLHVFVISWRNQHEKAEIIEAAVAPMAEKTTVIFTEPDAVSAKHPHWHQVPDEYYYGMKHKVALELHENFTANSVFIEIQADNISEEWAALVERARYVFTNNPNVGMYSPRVDGVMWTTSRCRIGPTTAAGLVPATVADPSWWALHPAIAASTSRVDLTKNNFGWGIGWHVSMQVLARGYSVLKDENYAIIQPAGTGYAQDEAKRQYADFLKNLTFRETLLLKSSRKLFSTRNPKRKNSKNALKAKLWVRAIQLQLLPGRLLRLTGIYR
jgi:hypothetical protein